VANRSKEQKAADNNDKKEIEIDGNVSPTSVENQNKITQSYDLGIVISNATAKWTDAQTENSLENINLNVRPGRLVAVIGPVGSGKVYCTIKCK
jgi:ATP-binding cassette subfamily C (CFTR/MRP) protein 4